MDSASILLLMSDDVERLRVEQILRHAGHEVVSVPSVEEASNQLVAEPMDLFICELDPRDKDRVSLLTATKWRLPYLARLLLCTKDEARIAQKALETGIVHFTLVPPVSQSVLLDTTQAMLKWAQEQRLGTPASKTGRNSAARHHQRETLDDDRAWELELDPHTERKAGLGPESVTKPGTEPEPEPESVTESEALVSSATRGRVEWYY